MGVDAGALVVAIIGAAIAVAAAFFSYQQASASRKSATSADKSADAATEQAISAKEQAAISQKQYEITERIRKEQNDPYVVVDIQESPFAKGFLYLVIENIGTTIARNVRIEFNPPLRTSREATLGDAIHGNIRDAKIFANGIRMLPPRRRLEFLFDFGPDRLEEGLDNFYSVLVEADGPEGPAEPMRYEIDLNILYGPRFHRPKTPHEGVEALESIRKALLDIHKIMNANREQ
ncbi:hypothetical protein HUT06_39535 [Actinomadura sp. NAK00032]|uniref:hypothetical protein n=1 Tax=Actinomadura sp. NAK00032 TaxID=2742128 RepID=UPI00159168D1|nr:hypothetical protein [Actinomadura sp. NAK00032]QKW39377.1 hypothetical protein HUT06_39535 [Actinomadura sp. NAK00032]